MSHSEIAKSAVRGQTTPEELPRGEVKKERWGQWQAAAVCGNHIPSSRLYVSAIVCAQALAPPPC